MLLILFCWGKISSSFCFANCTCDVVWICSQLCMVRWQPQRHRSQLVLAPLPNPWRTTLTVSGSFLYGSRAGVRKNTQVLRCNLVFLSPLKSFLDRPPLRSTVVRASARGAGGRGSIPTASHQRHKRWKVCASQLGAWHNELGNRLGGLESV